MNALRKQSPQSSQAALERFSATLDAASRSFMESLDFIAADPAPANLGSTAVAHPELSLPQRRARQLACLVNMIGVEFGGLPENIGEVELVDLAADLAKQLYVDMEPLSGTFVGAYAKTGQLAAITFAMCEAILAFQQVADVDERRAMANNFGWLQSAADDFAKEVVEQLEGLG